MITKQELVKLAKLPEPELYKMSYGEIIIIKDKIERLVHEEKDDKLFSILMKLKSRVMIYEDQIRYTEVRKIEKLASLEEIVSYIERSERIGGIPIHV